MMLRPSAEMPALRDTSHVEEKTTVNKLSVVRRYVVRNIILAISMSEASFNQTRAKDP